MPTKKFRLKEAQVVLKPGRGLYSEEPVDSPVKAARLLGGVLKDMDREYCCVVNLDCKLRPISYSIVSIGSLNKSIVEQTNVFKTAILANANAIMLLHNHPTGSVKPSAADDMMTRKVILAGRLLDIEVIDHIIVAGDKFYSFNENTDLFKENKDLQNALLNMDLQLNDKMTKYRNKTEEEIL